MFPYVIDPVYAVDDVDKDKCQVYIGLQLRSSGGLSAAKGTKIVGTPEECAKLVDQFIQIEFKDVLNHISPDITLVLEYSQPFFIGNQDPDSPSQRFLLLFADEERVKPEVEQ